MSDPNYDPGSHGCHEALHVASVIIDLIDRELCEHPAITQNSEWLALASAASSSLNNLYQAIAQKHI